MGEDFAVASHFWGKPQRFCLRREAVGTKYIHLYNNTLDFLYSYFQFPLPVIYYMVEKI